MSAEASTVTEPAPPITEWNPEVLAAVPKVAAVPGESESTSTPVTLLKSSLIEVAAVMARMSLADVPAAMLLEARASAPDTRNVVPERVLPKRVSPAVARTALPLTRVVPLKAEALSVTGVERDLTSMVTGLVPVTILEIPDRL